jgi:serine protease Do
MAAVLVTRARELVPAATLALCLSAPAWAFGPDSVADVAAPLLDAVVNISTAQTVTGSRSGGDGVPAPQLPEGSPFQDFFDEFFNDGDGSADGQPRRVQSLGSGFVIDTEGIIVTNFHVIEGADEITANFADGSKLPATLIGHDPKTDLALLKVEAGAALTAVEFGDSDAIRVGDWVMAIGNPFGLGGTLTLGIVSARNRDIQAGPYDDFIQTDASINRGNSGGPLFNMEGKVVGINTAIISPSGGSIGIGFAVPSEIAINVIGQLREFGETRRGWLGVRIQDVTDDVAKGLGMSAARGALVANVEKDGPAETGGILAGDVILTVDGKAVDAMHALPRMVADLPVGKDVTVVVLRDGTEQTLSITLGRLEDAEKAAEEVAATEPEAGSDTGGAEPEATPPVVVVTGPLGLSLADLSPETRQEFGIKPEVTSGIVVTGVAEGSPAFEKRLRPGDVIVEIGQERVTTPADFDARLAALKEDGRTNVQLVVQNKDGHVRWINLPLAE